MHEKAIGRKPRLEAYLEGQGDVVSRFIRGVMWGYFMGYRGCFPTC